MQADRHFFCSLVSLNYRGFNNSFCACLAGRWLALDFRPLHRMKADGPMPHLKEFQQQIEPQLREGQ